MLNEVKAPLSYSTSTMAKLDRVEIIKSLQERRKSKVILYILGDRQPQQILGTVVALDAVSLLQQIFKEEGRSKKISLVIHSSGGSMDTPWPFVNLIREFTNDFEVLIPRKALSAATLICLGCDRIVMSPFSQLSPVDPQGNYRTSDGKIEQIAIEDILGFIDFSKNKIGIKDNQGKIEILKSLQKIDAKVLGSINRTHSLIRKLTTDLLSLKRKGRLTNKAIERVVVNLTTKTYSHSHLIGRNEAKNKIGLGSMIQSADKETFELMEALYKRVDADLDLSNPLDVQQELQKTTPNPATISVTRCIAQSEKINFEGKSNIVILPNGQVPPPSFKWELV